MAKGQGSIFKDKRSPYWQIRYWNGTDQIRESTHTEDRKEALEYLQQKLAQVAQHGGGAHQVTIDALLNLLLKDYRDQDRSSLYTVQLRVEKHVRPAFGKLKASKLTTGHIRDYKEMRRVAGAAAGTVNREIAALRRAYNLGAVEDPPLVYRVPRILSLKEDNVREGFLEAAQYREILDALPDAIKPVFVLGYHLGMRKGELLKLHRDWVDLAGGVIYVKGRTTKNKRPKTVPIYGPMKAWLQMQLAQCAAVAPKEKRLFVWEDGSPVKDFRGSWEVACKAAGVPELLFHDLRRTAVRNMVRAGVPPKVAMEISGHRTPAMLWRYDITDTRDVVDAGQRTERYLADVNSKPVAETAKRRSLN